MSAEEARAALKKANADVRAATEVLAKARKATAAAREFVATIEHDLAQLRASNDHVAEARALDVIDSLKAGTKPQIKPLPGIAKSAAARAEAENGLLAARRALDRLGGEERLLEGDLAAAEVRATDAIAALMIGEADLMAARVRALEAEALALRLNLGFESGFLARLAPGRFSRALAPVLETNSAPFVAARASSAVWANFAKALAADADATLSFQK